ncbi:MAG: hypothetical protein AB8A67_01755 [Prochlorococcus sp.]
MVRPVLIIGRVSTRRSLVGYLPQAALDGQPSSKFAAQRRFAGAA